MRIKRFLATTFPCEEVQQRTVTRARFGSEQQQHDKQGKLPHKSPKTFGSCAMEGLKDKVVIVTGASAGIGEATALRLAALGACLTLTGRDQTRLETVAQKCVDLGLPRDKLQTLVGDLVSAAHRQEVIDKTVARFGGIDVLVNNAAVSRYGAVTTTSDEDFDTLIDTNLKSPFVLSKLAVPHLIKSKGNIVNVSSINASRPMVEMSMYCVSKAGVDMFTQCLALELAPHGVRVNAVNPGTVRTLISRRGANPPSDEEFQKRMEAMGTAHPLGRVAEPEDVADVILFLASDQARFVTGDLIYVDGGRHSVSPKILFKA